MSRRGAVTYIQHAVPLCLPNNCRFDEQTGECSKIDEDRNSLFVTETSLKMLKSIKGSYFDYEAALSFSVWHGDTNWVAIKTCVLLFTIYYNNCFCVLAST